jgi:hypothetical protein
VDKSTSHIPRLHADLFEYNNPTFVRAAARAFGNVRLALREDYLDLPDTRFQEWLSLNDACMPGRAAVGSDTPSEFVERWADLDDPDGYLHWLWATSEAGPANPPRTWIAIYRRLLIVAIEESMDEMGLEDAYE